MDIVVSVATNVSSYIKDVVKEEKGWETTEICTSWEVNDTAPSTCELCWFESKVEGVFFGKSWNGSNDIVLSEVDVSVDNWSFNSVS